MCLRRMRSCRLMWFLGDNAVTEGAGVRPESAGTPEVEELKVADLKVSGYWVTGSTRVG